MKKIIVTTHEELSYMIDSAINKRINPLKELISEKLNPKKIALFVDGQAVLAKAETQIKRRYKHLYSTTEFIDTLNLTPGTLFMDFVDEIIPEYLKSLKMNTANPSPMDLNIAELIRQILEIIQSTLR